MRFGIEKKTILHKYIYIFIYVYKNECWSVCLSVCLFVPYAFLKQWKHRKYREITDVHKSLPGLFTQTLTRVKNIRIFLFVGGG